MTGALHPHFWWYLARASGLTAWVLSLTGVIAGVALATRALGARPRPAWLLDLHRFVAGLTMVFLGVHIGALVADNYVHFGVVDVVLPVASGWKPAPVAAGVVAMWLLAAVELTSLLMRRLPRRLWRKIHLASYAVAVLSTVHGLSAGTDARNPGMVGLTIVAAGTLTFFLVYRVVGPKRRTARPAPRHEGVTVAG